MSVSTDHYRLPRGVGWMLLAAFLGVGSGCQLAAEGHNAEGVRQYRAGQYTAALQKFQQARVAAPNDADSYYNMAATFHQMAKAQSGQGAAQSDNEMFRQAETLYNQCLDIDSDHVECHRALGVLLVETGRQDAAFRLMKNWALDSPQLADARVELARLYQEFGDLETAQSHLQAALMVDQTNHRAWAALGALREQSGELAQALDNYQRSYNLNNFQPAVASKIAALSHSVQGGVPATSPNGTRTVTPARPVTR